MDGGWPWRDADGETRGGRWTARHRNARGAGCAADGRRRRARRSGRARRGARRRGGRAAGRRDRRAVQDSFCFGGWDRSAPRGRGQRECSKRGFLRRCMELRRADAHARRQARLGRRRSRRGASASTPRPSSFLRISEFPLRIPRSASARPAARGPSRQARRPRPPRGSRHEEKLFARRGPLAASARGRVLRPTRRAGVLFPAAFSVEHQLVQTDPSGDVFRAQPVVDTYGGSTLVSVRPGGSRVIVDFGRRTVTEVSVEKSTYWTLSFSQMGELSRRLAKADERPSAPSAASPRAANAAVKQDVRVEDVTESGRERLAARSGPRRVRGVRHLRASVAGGPVRRRLGGRGPSASRPRRSTRSRRSRRTRSEPRPRPASRPRSSSRRRAAPRTAPCRCA